jgi:glycosyltransferase involved in cell wall biosynthesis
MKKREDLPVGAPRKSQLRANPRPDLLSLVTPVFNEEETIPFLRRCLEEWSQSFHGAFEIVIVDDGSTDSSWDLLCDWAEEDHRVVGISLSRNFGHQAAVTAGLASTRGDVVVIIDADLQDPLEVIPEMILKYEEGFDVVYGQRLSREGETRFKLFTAWLFYRLMRFLVWKDLPPDTGDFRLVSRRCLDVVLRMGEVHRFLRGMFSWVGFHQTALRYHRRRRQFGQSKYPLSNMIKFAWNAALSFSVIPIKVISLGGFLTAGLGIAYGIYAVVSRLIFHNTVPGWTTLIVLISLIGGMILVALGMLGEYIAKIYEEIKRRPLFVVRDVLNGAPVQYESRKTKSAV